MKILITGANGFLGQHLIQHLSYNSNYSIYASGRGESRFAPLPRVQYISCDVSNEQDIHQLITYTMPDIFIHTAALTKPDDCEKHKEACWKINVDATQYILASLQQQTTARLIYISTDFVFGENGPHAENDVPAPMNYYGESKLAAEQLVSHYHYHNIVRTVFIYGKCFHGLKPTFLHWVKNNMEQHKNIQVVSDQLRTPTYIGDVCKGIESLLRTNEPGTFHFAGKDILSPYAMAVSTAKLLQLNAALINNVTSSTFKEPVQRPKKSGLRIDKAISKLGYAPVSFEEGVKLTFNLQ